MPPPADSPARRPGRDGAADGGCTPRSRTPVAARPGRGPAARAGSRPVRRRRRDRGRRFLGGTRSGRPSPAAGGTPGDGYGREVPAEERVYTDALTGGTAYT